MEPETQNKSASDSKYTVIWQVPHLGEEAWVREILASYVGEWVVDPNRQVVRDRAILIDRHLISRRASYYEKFRGRDAILIDLADENYDFDPALYSNFRGVIRCYWSNVFRSDVVHRLPLGYQDLKVAGGPGTNVLDRQYVWSFLGQANKSSRPEMIKTLSKVEPHLLFTTDKLPGFTMRRGRSSGEKLYSKERSLEVLKDSVFAPCPMGNVNLECYRIYEALECGAIPIVEKRIKLDYFKELWGKHPVPTVSSWREARALMTRMLEKPAELDSLQSLCMEWWSSYKTNLSLQIGDFLHRRSAIAHRLEPADIVYPRHARLGWQSIELLRHHSGRAVLRRFGRLARRVITSGKLRVSSAAQS